MPSSLLNILAESYPSDPNAVFRGAEGFQNVMSRGLDYQQKREALEAARGLRALYAQNPNPSYEDIARIDPAFAMQQNKANFEMQKDMLGARKTQGDIAEQDRKAFALTAAPIAEKYASVSDDPRALAQFHQELGGALAQFEQQSGIRPPPGFKLETLNPIGVLNWAAPYYQSQALDVQKQGQLRQLPPQMTAEQMYGSVQVGPYGFRRVPGIGGQPMTPGPQYGVTPFNPNAGQRQGASQQPAPYSFQAPSGAQFDMYDLGSAAQMAAAMPAGPDKDAALKYIDEQWSKMRSGQGGEVVQPNAGQMMQPPAGGFITTQQEQQMRLEEKQAEADIAAKKQLEIERGKQTIQEQASAKKATAAYDMLPDPDRIRNLIKGSVSGDLEYWTNRLGGVVGKSLKSGDITGALKVIQGQMADTVAMFPGAQSDKELEARMQTIGNPSGEISAETRLMAFDEWLNRMQKYAAQHADYDDSTLIDMVKSNKLTTDQAMQIRKRRMAGGQ